jgi:hypothetical protein
MQNFIFYSKYFNALKKIKYVHFFIKVHKNTEGGQKKRVTLWHGFI